MPVPVAVVAPDIAHDISGVGIFVEVTSKVAPEMVYVQTPGSVLTTAFPRQVTGGGSVVRISTFKVHELVFPALSVMVHVMVVTVVGI